MADDDGAPAADIEATALIPAPAEEVFAFLSDLSNHWRLANSHVEVLELDGDRRGGVVRVLGPLGLHRTARTHVTAAHQARLVVGVAELRGGTRARVSWTLAGRGRVTRVRLAAEIEHASPLDRLVLMIGGRAWMRRMFDRTLGRLADRFDD